VLTGAGVSVLAGNGNGTFQPAVNYERDTRNVIVAGDYNGDGRTDLAGLTTACRC
jgi:hypothetical protein